MFRRAQGMRSQGMRSQGMRSVAVSRPEFVEGRTMIGAPLAHKAITLWIVTA